MTLSKISRYLLGGSSLLLLVTYFVPLWMIKLWAPQYPEGLTMSIWHNNLSGEIDIINGLNHYIGMKHISVQMFPEFSYIGILIGVLILIGLVAAIMGSGRILFLFTLLSYGYAVAALWDFYRWGYEYGHNLDPNAAIKVPDMSYQPPVVGYRNLLNFTAYSGPDTGAWIIIAVCLLATLLWWWEFFKNRKTQKNGIKAGNMVAGVLLVGASQLMSCATGPEPIRYGVDECAHCKMTFTDRRFGAELITVKGKVFKFDDLNCLHGYLEEQKFDPKQIGQMLAVDFNHPDAFIPVEQAFFLQHESFKSPMRADVAVFASAADRDSAQKKVGGGVLLNWNELTKQLN